MPKTSWKQLLRVYFAAFKEKIRRARGIHAIVKRSVNKDLGEKFCNKSNKLARRRGHRGQLRGQQGTKEMAAGFEAAEAAREGGVP